MYGVYGGVWIKNDTWFNWVELDGKKIKSWNPNWQRMFRKFWLVLVLIV